MKKKAITILQWIWYSIQGLISMYSLAYIIEFSQYWLNLQGYSSIIPWIFGLPLN